MNGNTGIPQNETPDPFYTILATDEWKYGDSATGDA
jgi:hypothetical protein